MRYYKVQIFDPDGEMIGEDMVPANHAESSLDHLNDQLTHWGEEPTKIANAVLWALAPEVCHFDCDSCRA